MDSETVSSLVGVVLGAVLATGGGVATERWKQKRELRGAARLVWLEVVVGYTTLLAVIARGAWPSEIEIWDDAWKAQRDRLALGLRTEDFLELQSLFLALRALADAGPSDRADPVLYWGLLKSADVAARRLAEAAHVEGRQVAELERPLADRIESMRQQLARFESVSGAELDELQTDAVERAVESFPPELRARAAEALARQLAASSSRGSGGVPADRPSG